MQRAVAMIAYWKIKNTKKEDLLWYITALHGTVYECVLMSIPLKIWLLDLLSNFPTFLFCKLREFVELSKLLYQAYNSPILFSR